MTALGFLRNPGISRPWRATLKASQETPRFD